MVDHKGKISQFLFADDSVLFDESDEYIERTIGWFDEELRRKLFKV